MLYIYNNCSFYCCNTLPKMDKLLYLYKITFMGNSTMQIDRNKFNDNIINNRGFGLELEFAF